MDDIKNMIKFMKNWIKDMKAMNINNKFNTKIVVSEYLFNELAQDLWLDIASNYYIKSNNIWQKN